jgi:hypothetical protein
MRSEDQSAPGAKSPKVLTPGRVEPARVAPARSPRKRKGLERIFGQSRVASRAAENSVDRYRVQRPGKTFHHHSGSDLRREARQPTDLSTAVRNTCELELAEPAADASTATPSRRSPVWEDVRHRLRRITLSQAGVQLDAPPRPDGD